MAYKDYDFKKPLEVTSVGLSRLILSNLLEDFNTFVYEDIDLTDEQKAELNEKGIDFGIKTLGIMSTTDLPADYVSYPFDKLIAALSAIKEYVEGSVRQMADELVARTLETKSPVTNTYAKDCATLGTVMMTLKKVRESQGNNPDDYFIKAEKKDLSTDTALSVDKKD